MISNEYSLLSRRVETELDDVELDITRQKVDKMITGRDYTFIKFDVNHKGVDATILPKIKNSYAKQPSGVKYPRSAKSPRTKIHLKDNEENIDSARNDESLFLLAKRYSAR